MPLGTLDRTPPPFFNQGPSALSKLIVLGALALFLMVADARLKLTAPLRSAIAAVLYPVQWSVLQAAQIWGQGANHFSSLEQAQRQAQQAQERLLVAAAQSMQAQELALENRRLRQLLGMRARASTTSIGAQVLYDSADLYSRQVVIDRGQAHGVQPGAPVVDENGVLGQVTRVYGLSAEVTLLVERDQAIPVLNTRTGVRDVAYGWPSITGEGMELRFTLANADVAEGDLLSTSGIDGVYPPGLPVARVARIERRADSSFARIVCQPLANMHSSLHVLVLHPVAAIAASHTPASDTAAPHKAPPQSAAPTAKKPRPAQPPTTRSAP